MQLVLSNNRVIAHGENFIAMGGTVINTVTGVKYENATIAECEGCPSDIDSVGYEYHAGQFKPCAPYGKGSGNIAVLCDKDCKAIKDSGISIMTLFGLLSPLTLLWENASPSSSFSSQTITLSSSDWDFLMLYHYNGVEILPPNKTIYLTTSPNGVNYSDNDIYFYTDKITTTKTTVKFSAEASIRIRDNDNYPVNVEGVSYVANHPIKIYGIKLGVTL